MNPLTREFVAKAESDFAAASALARRRKVPLPDHVCFLAQQCLEKYLKARLHEAGITFPKTHDLKRLLALALPVEPMWQAWETVLTPFNEYSVSLRYPGDQSTPGEAKRALALCRKVRVAIRASLALKD